MILEQITFTGRELLIAVILATLVYLLETLFFSRRRQQRVSKFTHRLEALEKDLAEFRGRLDQVESRPPAGSPLDSQASIYAEAVRLARDGSMPQDMADRLGISRSEAELIVALHKGKP